jgi:hypothetical protein
VDGADAEAVVAKGLEGQWTEGGSLLGKHPGDLALRRAVDARVGPVRDAASEMAGLTPPESVDTASVEMAGFALDARRPRPGTTMPTAFR